MDHRPAHLRNAVLVGLGAAGLVLSPAPALAQAEAQGSAAVQGDARFDRFVPQESTKATRLDYAVWDEALDFFVFSMGISLRERAPTVLPSVGTRVVYGHDSPYRLEGNRVAFSYLEDDVIESLTTYRQDLESMADQLEIAKLPRNEQLAYWINLHNVAVIEQIALAYPLSRPSNLKIGPEELPLDEAPFITVNGVAMSPRDIRTKIVFPNWRDPKVMYGFFRGDIGGPSLRSKAFTGDNVDTLLDGAAREFVNALRGVHNRGSTLQVSRIYAEARPFFFPAWPDDLRVHLRNYASEEVLELLDKTDEVDAVLYEEDIADLAKGEKEPVYTNVQTTDENGNLQPVDTSQIPRNILRMVAERNEKLNKAIRRGDRIGRVIVLPDEPEEEEDNEVE